jgi:hypothetical protein
MEGNLTTDPKMRDDRERRLDVKSYPLRKMYIIKNAQRASPRVLGARRR